MRFTWSEIDSLREALLALEQKEKLKAWLTREIEVINDTEKRFECTIIWEELRLKFLQEVLGELK